MSETVEAPVATPAAPRALAVAPAPTVVATQPLEDDRRKDTLSDLRAEAAQYRIQAREAREQLASLQQQQAERIEAEKTKAAADALAPLQANFEKLRKQMLNTKVEAALTAAGIKDPDLVSMYARCPEAGEVTIDDDFNIQGLGKMVEAFKAWKPDFFAAPGAPAVPSGDGSPPAAPRTSAGGEPAPSGATPTMDVRGMGKKEYEAWKQETFKKMRQPGAPGWGG